jgi:hypothetical protein
MVRPTECGEQEGAVATSKERLLAQRKNASNCTG